MHSNHFILCHPVTSSSCLQPLPASGSFQMSQFFASGGQSIGVSISNISPSNDYSGLISFRMDWLYLLAVQETLKSLLQHHSSKASRHLLRVGTGTTKVKKKQSSALGTTLGSQLELLGERDSQDPSNYFSGPWAKVAESRGR